MAAHHYWRIYINSNVYGTFLGVAEISMASSAGGANLIGTGTAAASSIKQHQLLGCLCLRQ